MVESPTDRSLGPHLERPGRDHLRRAWEKALDRLDADPDGAITAARSLLESVCKHILDELGLSWSAKADLSELYGAVASALGLSAGRDIGRLHKQFLGATHTIIQSVGELRNKVGDAHGKGNEALEPSPAQAELAVNLAGAVGAFLLSVFESHVAASRRLTSSGAAVLRFDKSIVWRLIDHAQNSPSHEKSFGERRAKPSVWLVGDAGVYLMSNGRPALLHNGRLGKPSASPRSPALTAHAEGCDVTDRVEDWWPIHNAIAGGDDFCQPLPIQDMRRAAEAAKTHVVIVANQEFFQIYSDLEFESVGPERAAERLGQT